MYGTQTRNSFIKIHYLFENDVKMYGTQTDVLNLYHHRKFENDVKMYGTQTFSAASTP